jgi:hypothetical protein
MIYKKNKFSSNLNFLGVTRPNRYTQKGASLVGALLCYKGANDVGVLLSTWHTPGQIDLMGATVLSALLHI